MFSPLLIKISFATLSSVGVAVGGYFLYKKTATSDSKSTVSSGAGTSSSPSGTGSDLPGGAGAIPGIGG